METIIIIIIISYLIPLYIGYTIAKGIDNNHRELFQAYMDEQIKLTTEKNQYQQQYQKLYTTIKNNPNLNINKKHNGEIQITIKK